MIKTIVISCYIAHKIYWKRTHKPRVHGKLAIDKEGNFFIRKLGKVKDPKEIKIFVFGKGV